MYMISLLYQENEIFCDDMSFFLYYFLREQIARVTQFEADIRRRKRETDAKEGTFPYLPP